MSTVISKKYLTGSKKQKEKKSKLKQVRGSCKN
jgi:hypothetical protein